jgi:hypothetical protein
VTFSVLRIGVSACVLATTTVMTHAATPITLPFGDLGLQGNTELDLPVPPPPPQVVRPDVTRMRLIIKRVPVRGGCGSGSEEMRRLPGERRQAEARPEVKPSRLG